MKWSYGVTTVPQRRDDLLPKTLESLADAGFNKPRLFVDGSSDQRSYESQFCLEVTCRYPTIRAYGNWVLSLGELYIRTPDATHYAIFQDDIIVMKNLRSYLEKKISSLPDRGYLNLYTFPSQHVHIPRSISGEKGMVGFYPSSQNGRGAAGLIFTNEGVRTLLSHPYMIERPKDVARGHKSIDGGIITAMRMSGWKEYIHFPSLIQHMGDFTTIQGNAMHKKATTFLGAEYDAIELLNVVELDLPVEKR